MELYYLSFANDLFRRNQVVALDGARAQGLVNCITVTEESLLKTYPEFFSENPEIAYEKRGYGFWLWKPYLIVKVLESLPENAVLIYADSGISFTQNLFSLAELAFKHRQVFFNMPQHQNRAWVKRDIFVALGCDSEKYWNAPQVKAQWHLWLRCEDSLIKAREWLMYCRMPQLITDRPSIAPNFTEFVENRHDQSILSVLVHKWGNEIFRDPTQEGDRFTEQFPNSTYPMLGIARGLLKE